MEYGCIGEVLKHSFSKQIHNRLADYDYTLKELKPQEVDAFMTSRDFRAINVTIPYKETVIPYLSHMDEEAALIGAVNTVVNRDGKLYGYNTDFFGMCRLAERAGIEFLQKKVLILGTGGTSKTAYAVAKSLGAKEIVKASMHGKEGAVSYEEVYASHCDAEIIINTTPVGMFPNIFGKLLELNRFSKLCGVLDAVYNPLKTPLILEAKALGIAAEGGLFMLVAQAVRASEIFLDAKYDEDTCERIFKRIAADNKNIVLTGMPASGKSTVGALLAKKLNRRFIDTDSLIEERAAKSIPQIFAEEGEAAFRDIESQVIAEVSEVGGVIISTGGGAVLRESNISALRENGRLYFIDRPLNELIPTYDRPLSSTKEAIEKRYSERYSIYLATADKRIAVNGTPDLVAENIIKDFYE